MASNGQRLQVLACAGKERPAQDSGDVLRGQYSYICMEAWIPRMMTMCNRQEDGIGDVNTRHKQARVLALTVGNHISCSKRQKTKEIIVRLRGKTCS